MVLFSLRIPFLRMFSLTVYALISWPCNFFLSLTLSTTHNHLHALLPYISQCIFLFSFLRPVFFHNFYILAAFSLPLKRHSLASCQAEFCVINLNRTDWYLTLIFALAFSIITIGFATRFEICFCIFDHEFVIFSFNLPSTKGTPRNWIITWQTFVIIYSTYFQEGIFTVKTLILSN